MTLRAIDQHLSTMSGMIFIHDKFFLSDSKIDSLKAAFGEGEIIAKAYTRDIRKTEYTSDLNVPHVCLFKKKKEKKVKVNLM